VACGRQVPDRSAGLPAERGEDAFIDLNDNPSAMRLPLTCRFPVEGVQLVRAYPGYEEWRASQGRRARDWYEQVTEEPDTVSAPASEFVPWRAWPLQPPQLSR
jgi:hypothetical protein